MIPYNILISIYVNGSYFFLDLVVVRVVAVVVHLNAFGSLKTQKNKEIRSNGLWF